MNTKKRAYAFVIFIFLLAAFGIVYIFSELSTEEELKEALVTDAKIFKDEFEQYNDKILDDLGSKVNVTIDEENPMIKKEPKDIIEMINNKETFVVYFSYPTCSWCRNGLSTFIKSAKENNIEKIYYVDISKIRDEYTLNENNEAVKSTEGSEDYYKLLEIFGCVLEDYVPLKYTNSKGKEKEVIIEEKRIYAPNIITIKDGLPKTLITGLLDNQEDPTKEATEEQVKELLINYKTFFESLTNEDPGKCVCVDQKC